MDDHSGLTDIQKAVQQELMDLSRKGIRRSSIYRRIMMSRSTTEQKSLVLTEKYSLGLPNAGIGIIYIVCGTISLAVALIFLFKQKVSPRPLGSPSELNWN